MQSLNIIALGDWGENTIASRINSNNIKKNKDINFIILLGDNFYPSGVSSIFDAQWATKYREFFNINTFAVLGNHDHVLNARAQIEYSHINNNWKMPYYYYDMMISLENTRIHFIFIDTCIMADHTTMQLFKVMNITKKTIENFKEIKNSIQEKQNQWLEDVLRISQAEWKIVCGHYPVFSKGAHRICPKFQNYLSSLFEKYKVDLYLSGHDHNMQHLHSKYTNYVISGAFSNFYKNDSLENTTGFVRIRIDKLQMKIEFIGSYHEVMYQYLCSKL
jgi:acid phosphatase